MLELLASSPTISVGSAREDKSRHSFSPGSWVVSRDSRQECSWSLEFGDPGEVEEIRYPEILGGTGIVLCAYPIERTLAEKIATMMERGELNTRDRDFADVWVLSRIHTIGAVDATAGKQARCGNHPAELRSLSKAAPTVPSSSLSNSGRTPPRHLAPKPIFNFLDQAVAAADSSEAPRLRSVVGATVDRGAFGVGAVLEASGDRGNDPLTGRASPRRRRKTPSQERNQKRLRL